MSTAHNDPPPPPDDLDALLDFDDAVDDFRRDLFNADDSAVPTNHATNGGPRAHKTEDPTKDIDAEIQVRKPRRPNPKLDEERLLSDAGIPRLRKIARGKLKKFRGKGHEFTDVTHLLGMYQLWLDDLYPRAKFRDALAMVEKVGHSKRMGVVRRAWLEDTRGRAREESLERVGETEEIGEERRGEENANEDGDEPAADELDDLLAEGGVVEKTTEVLGVQRSRNPFIEVDDDDDEGEDDELDALMAEQETNAFRDRRLDDRVVAEKASGRREDQFADEEEAMAGLDW